MAGRQRPQPEVAAPSLAHVANVHRAARDPLECARLEEAAAGELGHLAVVDPVLDHVLEPQEQVGPRRGDKERAWKGRGAV